MSNLSNAGGGPTYPEPEEQINDHPAQWDDGLRDSLIDGFLLVIPEDNLEERFGRKSLKNEFWHALAYHSFGESEKTEHIDKKACSAEFFRLKRLYVSEEGGLESLSTYFEKIGLGVGEVCMG